MLISAHSAIRTYTVSISGDSENQGISLWWLCWTQAIYSVFPQGVKVCGIEQKGYGLGGYRVLKRLRSMWASYLLNFRIVFAPLRSGATTSPRDRAGCVGDGSSVGGSKWVCSVKTVSSTITGSGCDSTVGEQPHWRTIFPKKRRKRQSLVILTGRVGGLRQNSDIVSTKRLIYTCRGETTIVSI